MARFFLPDDLENYIFSFIKEPTPTSIIMSRLVKATKIWDSCTVIKTLVRKNRKRRATKLYKYDASDWF